MKLEKTVKNNMRGVKFPSSLKGIIMEIEKQKIRQGY